ncbi:MAG: tetratricopeptide repeat protein [Steroidobacteraceae bacterium]
MTESLGIVSSAGPDADPSVPAVLLGLGVIARSQYQAVQSVALLERARGALEAKHQQSSALYVQVLGALALSYQDANRPQDALNLGRYSMTLGKTQTRQDGPEYLEALEQFGSVMSNLDHDAEAVVAFHRVVAGYLELFGPESRRTLQAQGDYAICLMALGHFREAQESAEAALAGERRVDRPESPAYIEAARRVGRILFYRGAYEAALPLLRETYRLAHSGNPPADLDGIASGYDLARPLLYLGRFAEARELLKAELPADKTDAYAKYMRAMRTRWLGELEMQAGNLVDAERLLSEAERQFGGFKSADGSVLVKVRESHGWLLNLQGRHAQAAAQLQQVSDAYGKMYPADSAYVQIANVHRAAVLLTLNQKEAARKLLKGAKSVVEDELVPGAEARTLYAQMTGSL